MALSGSQKKLLLLVLAFACVSSSGAEADNSRSGSGSNSDGSDNGWAWGWGTNPDGSTWKWSWSPSSGWSWRWDPSGPSHNYSSSLASVLESEAPSSPSPVSESEVPRKIVVGGSEGWTKGLDYKEWASKNAPFYIDDVLVFKYDKHVKRRNNVYMFQDPRSYKNCDIKNAKKIGSTNTGSEESFKFTLKNKHPYFFASGEHDGAYCSNHNMKFTVFPVRQH